MGLTSEAVAFAIAFILSKVIDMVQKHKQKPDDTLSDVGKLTAADIEIGKLPNKQLADELKAAIYDTYTNFGIVPKIIVNAAKSQEAADDWKFLVVPDNIKVNQMQDGRMVYTVDMQNIAIKDRARYLEIIKESLIVKA